MSLLKYMERLKRMDSLIRRSATGTPDEFASKLNISKSMLMINLSELKQMGAPIAYDGSRQSYLYTRECYLKLEFELSKSELTALKGGTNFFDNLSYSNAIRMGTIIFKAQGR